MRSIAASCRPEIMLSSRVSSSIFSPADRSAAITAEDNGRFSWSSGLLSAPCLPGGSEPSVLSLSALVSHLKSDGKASRSIDGLSSLWSMCSSLSWKCQSSHFISRLLSCGVPVIECLFEVLVGVALRGRSTDGSELRLVGTGSPGERVNLDKLNFLTTVLVVGTVLLSVCFVLASAFMRACSRS